MFQESDEDSSSHELSSDDEKNEEKHVTRLKSSEKVRNPEYYDRSSSTEFYIVDRVSCEVPYSAQSIFKLCKFCAPLCVYNFRMLFMIVGGVS